MKKIFDKIKRNSLFAFLLGAIIFGSIGIYGANAYKSNTIEYSPTDSSWGINNVSDALNSLYNMKTELNDLKGLGNATAEDITSGKTAVVQGKLVTGTKEQQVRWSIISYGNEHMNIENNGKVKLKAISHTGGANKISIYGTNDPANTTHASNVTLITTCNVTSALDTTIDTGSEYEYLVLYNVYQTGVGATSIVQISY